MKKALLITIIALLALSSCQKSGMQLFRGDYSFKISGSVIFEETVSDEDPIEPLSFTASLPNEIG